MTPLIKRVAIIVVLLVLGVGALAWGFGEWRRSRGDASVVVRVGNIRQTVAAIGRIEPFTEVTLANKIPGRIREVLVKEGDLVKRGQVVIRFDDAEPAASARMSEARIRTAQADVRRAARGLESARARWAEAKSGARPQEIERARAEVAEARQKQQFSEVERARMKRLLDSGYIARAQYDAEVTNAEVWRARVRASEEALNLLLAGPKAETVAAAWAQVQEAEAELRRAESHVQQAQAELGVARAAVDSTLVEATVDGKVTRKLVEPGEAVDVSMPLMVLGDMQKIIVKAEVDETDVGKLALGQKAEITADAYPGRVFPGNVYEIGQAVGKRKVRPEDPAKIQDMKVLETKIEVIEGADELKLGMTVDVRVLVSHKDKVLVLPKRLVPLGAREATVRVRGPNGEQPRVIRLASRDDEHVEILDGLKEGERIIVTTRGR
jgi:ABC exporter DevB family membrane fusion protein